MKIFDEFKKFIMRGNVIDLAVGIIIGTAFGKITSSLVADVIMPPIGLLLAKIDLKELKFIIGTGPEGAISINYGLFIQSILDFLIIGLAIFFLVKIINSFNEKEEKKKETPAPTKEEVLLTEIRDLLKEKPVKP